MTKSLLSAAGLAVAAATAAFMVARWEPPRPLPESAPKAEFSAERAFEHVRELGQSPRPLGSVAHAAAREYLLAELRELGLEPAVQEATIVQRREADLFLAVKARNVLARLAGSDSTGALLLVSHYDSRPTTPGAGDALAGVAAILETLRALRAGGPLANDLIVLLSDAEELGLVGAQAFAERHPWFEDVRLVLNLEGRGASGPSLMFETREGNLDVVRGLEASAPHPAASSLSYEVYRRMPNDTDFSVFRRAGVQGLNVAFLGDHPAYHTRLDRPDNLDLGTLQHHGSYTLGVARHFGGVDLTRFGENGGNDAVYFNPWPWRLVVYPAAWALPLTALAVALLAVGAGLCRRHRRLELAGMGRGLVLFAATVLAAALVGWCYWWFLRNYLGGLRFGPHGLIYDTGWLVVSLAALLLATAGALGAWLDEGRRPLELWAGSWLGWAVAGLALAIWLPGASYLVTWPLLAGAVGLAIFGLPAREGAFDRSEPLILALAALPAVALLAPTVWTLTQALTLGAAAAIGATIGFLLTPLSPLLGALHRASAGRLSILWAVVSVGLLAWIAIEARPSSESPATDTLLYALDTESGEAWWASLDDEPDRWTARFLGEEPERLPAPRALALEDAEVLLAAADPAPLAAPTVEAGPDSRAAGRRIEGTVRSARGAAVLRVRAEVSVPFQAVSVEGERFEFTGDPEAEGLGEIRVTALGFGPEGVRIGFEMGAPWPVELDLADMSYGFDALPEPPATRPPELIPSSSWRTDAVYVRGSALL